MSMKPMSSMSRLKLETQTIAAAERRIARSSMSQEEMGQAKSISKIPTWHNLYRDLPNLIIRSSLFAAICNGKHPSLEKAKINTPEGTSIIYSGPQLNQIDLGVWATVVNLAKSKNFGSPLKTSNYQIRAVMGLKGGGASEKVLKVSLARLSSGEIETYIKESQCYKGKLIDRVEYEKNGRGMIIILNPELATLLNSDRFTRVDWKIFKALQKKPLAQWLHLFYSSHANPFALRIETIRQYCGSKSIHKNKFSQQLRKALEELNTVYTLNEKFFTCTINDGLVRVTKAASGSQARRSKK